MGQCAGVAKIAHGGGGAGESLRLVARLHVAVHGLPGVGRAAGGARPAVRPALHLLNWRGARRRRGARPEAARCVSSRSGSLAVNPPPPFSENKAVTSSSFHPGVSPIGPRPR